MSWLQTYDNRELSLVDPRPEQIDPASLAVALSRICRFGGHCREFYSVAQHSVLVSEIVPAEHALAGLLHDAHEAFSGFGDVQHPAKAMDAGTSTFLMRLEYRLDVAIAQRFGLPSAGSLRHRAVQLADLTALATEARDLLGPSPRPWRPLPPPLAAFLLVPLSPAEALGAFNRRLAELWSDA